MATNTYGSAPAVPEMRVISTSFPDGGRLADAQVNAGATKGGGDLSPQLAWGPAPEGTKSFAVTCWDADAPTGSGFWHWAVYNIPATVTSLGEGAGSGKNGGLPPSAHTLRGDSGLAGYYGAAPPEGHGDHRYIFAVHALDYDVDEIDIDADTTPARLGFKMFGHTLARGIVTGTWGR